MDIPSLIQKSTLHLHAKKTKPKKVKSDKNYADDFPGSAEFYSVT
jgi:hypothetical protein